MTTRAGERGEEIFGRDAELAAMRAFVAAEPSPSALVLRGGPGIGKTTLWEAGVAAAREQGRRVLRTRATGAEAQLSLTALIDLLEGIDLAELSGLPVPQLNALEVALHRAEPGGAPPSTGAIALGFLNALRTLAAGEALVVAIDDVQWLDPPSDQVLGYAARRLEGAAVGFLLATRPGRRSFLERTLEPRSPERLDVAPLSFGATRRLLSDRLGLSLRRHVLRRVVESTLGNPLFALEVGRALAADGSHVTRDEIPVPDAVEDLLGTRVSRLPGPVRRVLLAAALSPDLRVSQLVEIAAGGSAVDEAVDAGVLLIEGDRVRAAHPLLAAAARKRSRLRARRELHLELAGVVADPQLRARHLALATDRPDDELAATLAEAAAGASARGARQEAVELAQHALRLTPPGSPERSERLLALGGYLETAGELQRLTDLLTPELDALPPGAMRVRAWLLLSEAGGIRTFSDLERHLDAALAECGDDPGLRALVLARKSIYNSGVSQIARAEAWALEALPAARGAGPQVERLVLYGLSWARALGGRAIDDLCARFDAVSDAASYLADSPERVAGQRLVWRGELEEARTLFTRLLAIADERGEPASYALQRLHLCELELRIGDWAEAERLLDEWAESSDRELLVLPMYERCRALLAVGRGLPDEAERWAAEAVARADAVGVRWEWLEATRARGVAHLLLHEPARAAESLRAVWKHTQREGVDEPGVFPVAPELVEALAELGELAEARAVTRRLRELAEQQQHPWGLATTRRCEGLVRLAGEAYDEEAAETLAQAAAVYGELGLRSDRARSLLLLGRAQRRHRKWAAARGSLEEATAAFEALGSPGWAEEAKSELARVGARRPQPSGELTPTQRRVAELAAEGLSNKEIARTLFVTVHTVEVHLSQAYAKLGVRSRAQLAGRLTTP